MALEICQRHGIRQLTLQGEKLSADWPAAENFIASFERIIENGQYTLNQILNSDETFIINFYLESLWFLRATLKLHPECVSLLQ